MFDRKHGEGQLTLADGSTYLGEFRDGAIQGKGTYNWINGRRYVGSWIANKMDGFG